MINNLELAREDTSCVDITCVRFNGFIITKNLSCGCCRHRSQEEAVAYTKLGNALSEASPVKICGLQS